MLSHDDDTIIAQCTPVGKGALALIRLSGKTVKQVVAPWAALGPHKRIDTITSHTVTYGKVVGNDGQLIDQVLFIVMDGPRTFTGQDTIEITCHNNPFIIESIITCALAHGARLAQEGEFSRRAFLHGKIDLLQAEGIAELIHATNQYTLKHSLAQLQGSLSFFMSEIETELLKIVAWCEASFEFLDEERDFQDKIRHDLHALVEKLAHLRVTFPAQQQLKEGIRIALIGAVNAGKSSLFNCLLHKQRAIVTEIAGTTRDVIEAGLYHQDTHWTLIDTAGIRTTDNLIEQEGIVRSLQEAQKADIILLIFDGTRPLTLQETETYAQITAAHKTKLLLVHNKKDLPSSTDHPLVSQAAIAVCAHAPDTSMQLLSLIQEKIVSVLGTTSSPFLLNKRQQNLLISLENRLIAILPLLLGAAQFEIISYQLQDALSIVSELTGKSISEASLDLVFKEFCVGK